jgi:hypothetical protein
MFQNVSYKKQIYQIFKIHIEIKTVKQSETIIEDEHPISQVYSYILVFYILH